MSTFGLIHGAWHGAWCWSRLTPELERLGHRSIAVDLPIEDEAATTIDYADHCATAFAGTGGLVVVAHSMAGLVAPLLAERMPLVGIVYLAGVLRRPGRSLADDRADGVNTDFSTPGHDFSVTRFGENLTAIANLAEATDVFYNGCSPEDAAWAFSRLRKQRRYWTHRSPQSAWPDVPRVSVVCTDDHAVNPVWSRRVAREWLGVEPVELASDHSPFLSRPKQLAALLDNLARARFPAAAPSAT
jgi:pimeloyl-ACP methyl ester carboxylesterase